MLFLIENLSWIHGEETRNTELCWVGDRLAMFGQIHSKHCSTINKEYAIWLFSATVITWFSFLEMVSIHIQSLLRLLYSFIKSEFKNSKSVQNYPLSY